MSDATEHSSDEKTATEGSADAVNLQDLVLSLNFVPTWARKPSSGTPYGDASAETEDERRSGTRPPGSRDRDDRRGPGPRRSDRRGPNRERQPARRDEKRPDSGGRPREPRREERPYLPVDVHFIPDRDRLAAVVRQLHAVKRAFPLPYLAGFFLVKPDYHMIKLESRPQAGAEPLSFFQCRETKVVFLSMPALQDYLVRTHLEKHFDRVELTMEPPTGNFVCVGQCKRTGTLLGPPNFHGYLERLMELHRKHFPHLSLDEYRNQIEMVRDEAVIAKWKEECRTQIRYRPKDKPEAEANLTLVQAESQFIEQHLAAYVHVATKVIVPAKVVHLITEERLRQVIHAAWVREDRFPLSLMLALRPAFRRMRLHLFKAGKDETFVTAIPPKPLDTEHAIPEIKDMVALIAAHPGWNRKQLVEKLYPGQSPDDPAVIEKMSPLVWLVDKGHVIEFFNGTYAIPGHLKSPENKPADSPAANPRDGDAASPS